MLKYGYYIWSILFSYAHKGYNFFVLMRIKNMKKKNICIGHFTMVIQKTKFKYFNYIFVEIK
jgi:hypothetical protein